MPAINTLLSITTEKDDDMNIYMFMSSMKVGDLTLYYMVQTSIFLNDKEEEGYWRSLLTHKVENNVLAIPQGNYRLRIQEERVLAKGLHFRACSFASRDLMAFNYRSRISMATASWATAERATFYFLLKTNKRYFDQSDVIKDFGFKKLGINATYGKKLTKRLQEILRNSSKSLYFGRSEDVVWTTTGALALLQGEVVINDKLVIAEFRTPEIYDPEIGKLFYDGINMVDMEVVIAAIKDQPSTKETRYEIRQLREAAETHPIVGRYIFRLLGELGLLKGDCYAVVGLKARTGADIIYHTENLKFEIDTNDCTEDDPFTVMTFDNHEPFHEVNWDSQSTINFRYGLSEEHQATDVASMLTAAQAVIEEQEIPKWMLAAPDIHLDAMGLRAADVEDQAVEDFKRWTGYGQDVLAAQNYGSVWLGGMVRRMETFLNKDPESPGFGFNKKPFIPMSHATSVGVITYRALEDMALINLNHLDQSVVNTMVHVGALIPDDRWIKEFKLHGGQDLDDTNNLHFRMVYCSDPAYLALLVLDGVINEIDLPTTPEEAIEMGLFIRSPNGAGEYSVNKLSPELQRGDPNTPVLDLAKMPRGSGYLLGQCKLQGISIDTTITYGVPFTAKHAEYILDGQAMNPSIGQVANALMVWHEVVGSTMPPELQAALEDMVDTVQQGHDHLSIADVAKAPKMILEQLADYLEAHPEARTDKMLVIERLGSVRGDHMTIIRGRMADKRPTRINGVYSLAVRAIRALIREKLFALRAETKLYKVVHELVLPKSVMDFAKLHVDDMNERFRSIQRNFSASPYDSPFRKVALRMALTENIRAVVEEKVNLVKEDPALAGGRIVAMYKYIIDDRRHKVNGVTTLGAYDQVIFRSAGASEALFDLLGQTIRNSGLLEN